MDIPAPFGDLIALGPAVAMAWTFAVILKRRTVARSRWRYSAATAEKALRFPTLAHMVAALFLAVAALDLAYIALDGLALAVWVLVYLRAVRGGDDDDDWFSDLGRRLSRLSRLAPAGSAA